MEYDRGSISRQSNGRGHGKVETANEDGIPNTCSTTHGVEELTVLIVSGMPVSL